MTIHEILHHPLRQLLMSVHFLLLAAQMAVFFTSGRDERNRKIRLFLALHILFGAALFFLMMACTYRNFAILSAPKETIRIFTAFESLPVLPVVVYEGFTAAALLWSILDLIRYRKNHPTSRSIKETLDLLPVGIAFLKEDGRAVFHNLVMDHLAQKISGKPFMTFRDIQKGNSGLAEHPDALIDPGTFLIASPAERGTVWQVSSERTIVDGEPFIQLTAADITAQSNITQELEENHEKLREIHMRLDIYNKQAERMIISQELLTARMAVHNELGNVLLESRHYLNNPASFDEEMLLRALKNTNTYLLREYEEDDSAGDALTDALEMADAIGVEVTIAGITPQTDPSRGILAAAIIECATNTVKHADGSELSVEIRKADQRILYRLFGNGQQPQGAIRESGGLKSLRTLVEKEHGTMEICSSPHLTITISLPSQKSQAPVTLPSTAAPSHRSARRC